MSKLLQHLEAQLAEAGTEDARAALLARKAAYLARVGRFGEAAEHIAALRAQFGDGRVPLASAWLMWAEGVLHYYSELSPRALDRVARAQLLALAMRNAELAAVTSAWKAHIEFETSRFEAMGQSLELAIQHAAPENSTAITRLSMVISDALFLSGDHTNAQRWFMRGRDSALSEGDQASVEALVYNRAAFRLAWLRAQHCLRGVSRDETSALRLEIQSAKNLQDLTQIRALTDMVMLCDARAATLDGRYEAAMQKLASVQGAAGPFAPYNYSEGLVALEIAYCHSRLGDVEAAWSIIDQLKAVNFSQLDADDQLVAAWMRREMAAASDRLGSLQQASEQFRTATGAYASWLASIVSAVDGLRERGPAGDAPTKALTE